MSWFARMWPRVVARLDERGGAEHRARLLAGLSGTVVEVGAGIGSNFAHYPAAVTRVVAIEPEPELRAQAAAAADARIEVSDGVADSLPLGDGEADAVVFSLVLCSVPDQASALAEARRVLRAGGELRFYEHVVPRGGLRRAAIVAVDRSGIWPALAGGCHPARDTEAAIRAAGFTIREHERFPFSGGALEPSIPHVIGVATR
jgi:SAM-dependent methyltransferase